MLYCSTQGVHYQASWILAWYKDTTLTNFSVSALLNPSPILKIAKETSSILLIKLLFTSGSDAIAMKIDTKMTDSF